MRTLKYYGTVYDKKGDGHHARIFRVNDRSAPWEIDKATSGDSTGFRSKSDPLETSLPAHFRVCIYEKDTSIACIDKFRDAGVPDDEEPRQQADRIMRMDYRAFIKLKRDKNKRPRWFNRDDDGCSGPAVIEAYRHVFDQPCQQHDFATATTASPRAASSAATRTCATGSTTGFSRRCGGSATRSLYPPSPANHVPGYGARGLGGGEAPRRGPVL